MPISDRLFFSDAIVKRRATLQAHFDVRNKFEQIEESCIPSYVHRNPLAAWVAWKRTEVAAALYNRFAPDGPILDFGAATGEVGHLIKKRGTYSIIEQDNDLAEACNRWQAAQRTTLESAAADHYSAIFALDSLEHNDDIDGLVDGLLRLLAPNGIFILSGPTESQLYKLGRRIAGFEGHYHHSNIFDIERIVARHVDRFAARRIPVVGTLFHVTVWRRPTLETRNGR